VDLLVSRTILPIIRPRRSSLRATSPSGGRRLLSPSLPRLVTTPTTLPLCSRQRVSPPDGAVPPNFVLVIVTIAADFGANWVTMDAFP
jgi:hypothetical protein